MECYKQKLRNYDFFASINGTTLREFFGENENGKPIKKRKASTKNNCFIADKGKEISSEDSGSDTSEYASPTKKRKTNDKLFSTKDSKKNKTKIKKKSQSTKKKTDPKKQKMTPKIKNNKSLKNRSTDLKNKNVKVKKVTAETYKDTLEEKTVEHEMSDTMSVKRRKRIINVKIVDSHDPGLKNKNATRKTRPSYASAISDNDFLEIVHSPQPRRKIPRKVKCSLTTVGKKNKKAYENCMSEGIDKNKTENLSCRKRKYKDVSSAQIEVKKETRSYVCKIEKTDDEPSKKKMKKSTLKTYSDFRLTNNEQVKQTYHNQLLSTTQNVTTCEQSIKIDTELEIKKGIKASEVKVEIDVGANYEIVDKDLPNVHLLEKKSDYFQSDEKKCIRQVFDEKNLSDTSKTAFDSSITAFGNKNNESENDTQKPTLKESKSKVEKDANILQAEENEHFNYVEDNLVEITKTTKKIVPEPEKSELEINDPLPIQESTKNETTKTTEKITPEPEKSESEVNDPLPIQETTKSTEKITPKPEKSEAEINDPLPIQETIKSETTKTTEKITPKPEKSESEINGPLPIQESSKSNLIFSANLTYSAQSITDKQLDFIYKYFIIDKGYYKARQPIIEQYCGGYQSDGINVSVCDANNLCRGVCSECFWMNIFTILNNMIEIFNELKVGDYDLCTPENMMEFIDDIHELFEIYMANYNTDEFDDLQSISILAIVENNELFVP